MKRILLAICVMALSVITYGQNSSVPKNSSPTGEKSNFTFAWLTDVHLNSFAYAEDDLRQSIEDINANPAIDFTILSGDVTEFGDTKEFYMLQDILKNFKKPYLLLPGNHDVNWSENGCTMFDKVFRASHFCYDWKGMRFIGCGAGPSLRMGPPHIPREEILWLDSIVRATPKEQPIIFVNHFPLNQDLSNWYEVIDILKTRNIQVALAGHLHANRAYDAEGIPGVIGRSSLRRKDPIGGYNLVTVAKDTIRFNERIIKTETLPAWNTIPLAVVQEKEDTVYYRPDFNINAAYPSIREVWKMKDITDVASQGSIDENLYIYTNTAGMVHALDVRTGKTLWTYATGNKIFSAPFITPKLVIVSSCDGYIYALDKKKGTTLWKYNTNYPIVACPVVADGAIYIGSSNGKFYSIRLADGTLNWVTEGLNGYIESRPAIDKELVYIGTWGAMFYAFDRTTGKKVWEFDTKRGRYFSPGACWPVALPYAKNGTQAEQIIVLSSDYFVRAFNPQDGTLLWASDEAKGRESLGFSPDGKTMYIKGIKNNITAVDISKGTYTPLWNTLMPYESNFIPTRMETTEDYVFIPTEFGVVHAVRTDGSGIAWSHKVSHSAVTSLKCTCPNRLIVMTMDGTVTCLRFPKK
ncbi:PQQ-binding-like beta-propeller repeat protein [Bacteroides sp.]|uniref:outer membrane protein assembly factor BamB family protein n=1 Tax=Bacteroides sp. TaxID=29523 RepID=UPI002605A5E2|nr:PQQ-binding-like beta-propeller repeat protein [Bacteroides sp.]